MDNGVIMSKLKGCRYLFDVGNSRSEREDRAEHGHREVQLEVPVVVPAEGGDALAWL